MTAIETILLNFELARERSLMIFQAIPEEHLHWKPDAEAQSLIETVRHIYECDDWFTQIIRHQMDAEKFAADFESRPYYSIADEIEQGKPYQDELRKLVSSFTDHDLENLRVVRPKWNKSLGEFLLRCVYHETYHAGQLQWFLRMLDTPRPNVWL